MNKLQMTELMKLHLPDITGRQVEMFIEMAGNDIAEKTGIVTETKVINSVAGQRWYNLDSFLLKIDKVSFNDVLIPKLIGDPIIEDDEFVQPADSADTALSTPSSNAENKRFWSISYYDASNTQVTTAYDDKDPTTELTHSKGARIGILEKVNNAITRDGRTSNFQSCSVSGTTNIRVYYSRSIRPFAQGTTTTNQSAHADAHRVGIGPLQDIPSQFHDVLLDGAISYGYKFPPSMDLNMFTAFSTLFEKGLRKIKKFQRTKTATGFIKPQDF